MLNFLRRTSFGPTSAIAAALIAMYLGERTLVGLPRQVALIVAGVLMAAGYALALGQVLSARGERRVALGCIGRSLACTGLGVAVYVAAAVPGAHPTAWWGREALGVSQGLWPGLIVWGLVTAAAQARALHSMRHAPALELWRLHQAARGARIILLSWVSFAAVNYAATTQNRKMDLSYFRTTQVGEATANRVAGLTQPLTLSLFFPPGNDVREQVRAYAHSLAQKSPWVTVEILDQALEPNRARALRVRHNGVLAITANDRTELVQLGLDVEEARTLLRRLDAEVYQRLVRVLAPARVVYLTTGHAERDTVPGLDAAVAGLTDFKVLLEARGFAVRPLGLAQGLGDAIPADASVVAIMGPQTPLSAPELAALRRYGAAGGHLLVCLDPDRDSDNDDVLAPLGLSVNRTRIANPHYQVRADNESSSPHNLITVRFAEHPSVITLARNPGRLGVVLLGASQVAPRPGADANLLLTPTAWAMPDSFVEGPGTGKTGSARNAPSPMGPLALAQAVTYGTEAARAQPTPGPAGLRAVVVGDVDFATDGVLRNPGNSYFVSDAVEWLASGSTSGGQVADEQDVPLVHRKDGDGLWFYGISFGVPALVLALGLAAIRRDVRRLRPVNPTDAGHSDL